MAKTVSTLVVAAFAALTLAACGGGRSATSPTTTPTFSGDATSGWCAYAHQLQTTAQLNGSFQKDPKAWVAQVTAMMAQAEASAPTAISADVATMAGGVRGLVLALTADQYNFGKLNPQQLAMLQDPGFVTAGQRVTAYDQQVCHTPS